VKIFGRLFRAVLAGPFQVWACAEFQLAFLAIVIGTQALFQRPKIVS